MTYRSIDVNWFKRELANYTFYNSKILKLKDRLLEIETGRGLHAVRYDKEPVQGSQDPSFINQQRLEVIELVERVNKDIDRYKGKLDYIEKFILDSEYGASVYQIHCLGKSTYEKEADKLHMSKRTLQRAVNRSIEDYIND